MRPGGSSPCDASVFCGPVFRRWRGEVGTIDSMGSRVMLEAYAAAAATGTVAAAGVNGPAGRSGMISAEASMASCLRASRCRSIRVSTRSRGLKGNTSAACGAGARLARTSLA